MHCVRPAHKLIYLSVKQFRGVAHAGEGTVRARERRDRRMFVLIPKRKVRLELAE